jgi:hypothetical protein
MLTLKTDRQRYINEIKIIDAAGRLVKQLPMEYYLHDELTIDIEDLSKGFYQLQIINETGFFSISFLRN